MTDDTTFVAAYKATQALGLTNTALRTALARRFVAELGTAPRGHQVRDLLFQKKQLGKQLGKASATIGALRNELAEARERLAATAPNRQTYHVLRETRAQRDSLLEQVADLKEKLAKAEAPKQGAQKAVGQGGALAGGGRVGANPFGISLADILGPPPRPRTSPFTYPNRYA